MKRANLQQLTAIQMERIFINGQLNFVNMSDGDLAAWSVWASKRHEQDYHDARQRSYFRINNANMTAEIHWRAGDIPF